MSIEYCLNGMDNRTTVLLKNVPRDYTRDDALDEVKQQIGLSRINALHMPENDVENFGYCLINVTDSRYVAHVAESFRKHRWTTHSANAMKMCAEVTYAKAELQGASKLVDEFGERVLLD